MSLLLISYVMFIPLYSYVNNSELLNGKFKQLVGGVIWLVRNGSNYVDNSKITECPNVQETGHCLIM